MCGVAWWGWWAHEHWHGIQSATLLHSVTFVIDVVPGSCHCMAVDVHLSLSQKWLLGELDSMGHSAGGDGDEGMDEHLGKQG